MNNEQQLSCVGEQLENEAIVILDRIDLKCISCSKPLAILVKVSNSQKTKKYSAKCPCGDSSFKKKLIGNYRFCPADGVAIVNMNSNDVEDIYEMAKT